MVQKAMIAVYPIRYTNGNLEFLIIKRVKLSYNWQCVTSSVGQTMGALDHPKGETPIESARRELFEETGYSPTKIVPVHIPQESYFNNEIEIKELKDNFSPENVEELLSEIFFYNFIALIDQTQDPVLNPSEHSAWDWCSFEVAYNKLMWAVEKKMLTYIYKYLTNNPLK